MRKRRAFVPHVRVPVLLPTTYVREDARKPIISASLWPEIHQRYASGESLRELARCYGVSYETIRGIIQRPVQGAA